MNPLRKKPHQKSEIDRLKEELRLALLKTPTVEKLMSDLEISQNEISFRKRMYDELAKRYSEAMSNATRYEDLRALDVLVMDEEGVKNLTGKALDDYCDRKSASEIHTIMENAFSNVSARGLASRMQNAKDEIVTNLMLDQLRRANDARSKS